MEFEILDLKDLFNDFVGPDMVECGDCGWIACDGCSSTPPVKVETTTTETR